MAAALGIAGASRAADGKAAPKILLRSSWQTVNIGDIGHTPGVLHLLEQHVPQAQVRLWGNVGDGVEEMAAPSLSEVAHRQGRRRDQGRSPLPFGCPLGRRESGRAGDGVLKPPE